MTTTSRDGDILAHKVARNRKAAAEYVPCSCISGTAAANKTDENESPAVNSFPKGKLPD